MNKIVLILVCIILVSSFFTDFHPKKILAAEIFVYEANSNTISNLNYSASNYNWISYNDGYADDAFGLTGGGVITMALELTDAELAPYRNYVIDKINVAFGSENNPPGEIVNYEVWIKNYLPGDPYCSCVSKVATGTSTGDIWDIIDVSDTAIPDTGNLFIGINVEHLAGQYPCGVDQNQSGPNRAALMTYQGYGSWTDLFIQGFPGVWCIDVSIYPNNPPNTPVYLNPSNHETNVDINDSLLWTCSDPEGDFLTYDVYFGTISNPPLVSKDRTLNYFNPPGEMNYNTKYYWKIVAKDEYGAFSTGPIWDFTTISEPNNPPYQPSNPNPSNHAIDVDINTNLSWTGGDPDPGDTVTYDVYFGSTQQLPKIASNISNTSINPGFLSNGVIYTWSIVAWDNHGASTGAGAGWIFTTINPDNNPPNKPSKPYGERTGKIGKNYTYITNATDPDGDYVYYMWDWGDETNSSWLGPYGSGLIKGASHAWIIKGIYSIRVKVKDIYGDESDWSEPFVVSMSKTKLIYIPLFLQRFFQHFLLFEKLLNQIII